MARWPYDHGCQLVHFLDVLRQSSSDDCARILIHLKNRGDLQILVEDDKRMFNQYGVILVDPAKHPNVKSFSPKMLSF